MSTEDIFAAAVGVDRFSMRRLLDALADEGGSCAEAQRQLVGRFGEGPGGDLYSSLVRFAFLIEPVVARITTTKYTARWISRPADNVTFAVFDEDDPRFSNFGECCDVFDHLVETAVEETDEASLSVAWEMHQLPAVPYEVPIDYASAETAPLHTVDNVQYIWADGDVRRALMLRLALLSRHDGLTVDLNDDERSKLFTTFKKITTKAHLTDRAQTGTDKTNREKRWEVVPNGAQHAFRRESLQVEFKLLRQICAFVGFPSQAQETLVAHDLLHEAEIPARCPITLDPLEYEPFIAEVGDPTQGSSDYHVGHIQPLRIAERDPRVRLHVGDNISWISAVGNRIQGNLSVGDAIALIRHVAGNWVAEDERLAGQA